MNPLTYWQKEEVLEKLLRSQDFKMICDEPLIELLRSVGLLQLDELLKFLGVGRNSVEDTVK
jgi:hypothetical protein